MKKFLRPLALVVAAGTIAVACQKAPYTGRTQYNIVPDSVMREMGESAFAEMVQGSRIEQGTRDAQVLEQVGANVASAVDEPGYEWEFVLVDDDDTINAWALPGGYVGFYSGILPVVQSEAGMAFVMGHEIAHAVADHGAERMSQQLTVMGGLTALDLFLTGRASSTQRQTILAAMGLGAQVGILLPYSRAHESEADLIGMMYMADAGYPPEEGIAVWERMEAQTGGQQVPEFASTHPATYDRQAAMREWLPRARRRYERNALPRDTTAPIWPEGAPRASVR